MAALCKVGKGENHATLSAAARPNIRKTILQLDHAAKLNLSLRSARAAAGRHHETMFRIIAAAMVSQVLDASHGLCAVSMNQGH
jgi:hypothetical protein